MLIYEKDNKLNINFENSVEETPDLQISKESGKTEVKIDGQPGSSGNSSNFVFDLANAKRPEIDGVAYNYVYVHDESKNMVLQNVFVYDLNGYPPIISVPNEDETEFLLVETACSLSFTAWPEMIGGELEPVLLEDAQCTELSTEGSYYFIFPTTAKFGLRKTGGDTPK